MTAPKDLTHSEVDALAIAHGAALDVPGFHTGSRLQDLQDKVQDLCELIENLSDRLNTVETA